MDLSLTNASQWTLLLTADGGGAGLGLRAWSPGEHEVIQLNATRKLFAKLPLDSDGQLAVNQRIGWLYEQPAIDVNPLSD